VLFLDAIYLPVRPSGPKESVICAWGITETGDRELVCMRLGHGRPRRTGSNSAAI
jgi:transposase-like protein